MMLLDLALNDHVAAKKPIVWHAQLLNASKGPLLKKGSMYEIKFLDGRYMGVES